MRATRIRLLLGLLACAFGAITLTASPAAADVDCADLGTQPLAQSYLEGRPGDLDRLDADNDGRACEASTSSSPDTWVLIGLGVLLVAALGAAALRETRLARAQRQERERLPLVPPMPWIPQQATESVTVSAGPRQRLLAGAAGGSLDELAHALRLVPYADRLPLLEEHAWVHGTEPQRVLDALAERSADLELQGWALAGYDAPSTVRLLHCDCVGGLRNHKLGVTADGERSWSCATCRHSVRQVS